MERFITQLLLFALFPLLYFGGNALLNTYLIKNGNADLVSSRVVILGDSHPMNAIDPELFSNAQNYCQGAEPFVVTYWKANAIFKSFLPDTLIIGFSPHNLSAFNDFKFQDKEWSTELFRRTYPIEDLESIDDRISIDYLEFWRMRLKGTAFYPTSQHGDYIGNFVRVTKDKGFDWETPIARHYFKEGMELAFSETMISHLDSIVNLCQTKGVIPVLVTNPVHSDYFDHIPEKMLKTYLRVSQDYASKGIHHVDYLDYHYPDSLFMNSDHMNEKGAQRFTQEVLDELNTAQHD